MIEKFLFVRDSQGLLEAPTIIPHLFILLLEMDLIRGILDGKKK
jgi:hypothetical protein